MNTKTDPVITTMADDETDIPIPSSDFVTETDLVVKPVSIVRWMVALFLLLVMVLRFSYPQWAGFFKASAPLTKHPDALTALVGVAAPVLKPVQKAPADQQAKATGTILPSDLPLPEALGGHTFTIPTSLALVSPAVPVQTRIDEHTAYEAQLTMVRALLKTQQQQCADARRAFETQLKGLNDKVRYLEKQLLTPRGITARLATKRIKTKMKTTLPAVTKTLLPSTLKTAVLKPRIPVQATSKIPPFQLVSIDHWGNETHAVVRYQGELHTLMPGNSMADWTVEGFDGAGQGAYLSSSRGKKALLVLH